VTATEIPKANLRWRKVKPADPPRDRKAFSHLHLLDVSTTMGQFVFSITFTRVNEVRKSPDIR
jgi:hypothetical protein